MVISGICADIIVDILNRFISGISHGNFIDGVFDTLPDGAYFIDRAGIGFRCGNGDFGDGGVVAAVSVFQTCDGRLGRIIPYPENLRVIVAEAAGTVRHAAVAFFFGINKIFISKVNRNLIVFDDACAFHYYRGIERNIKGHIARTADKVGDIPVIYIDRNGIVQLALVIIPVCKRRGVEVKHTAVTVFGNADIQLRITVIDRFGLAGQNVFAAAVGFHAGSSGRYRSDGNREQSDDHCRSKQCTQGECKLTVFHFYQAPSFKILTSDKPILLESRFACVGILFSLYVFSIVLSSPG